MSVTREKCIKYRFILLFAQLCFTRSNCWVLLMPLSHFYTIRGERKNLLQTIITWLMLKSEQNFAVIIQIATVQACCSPQNVQICASKSLTDLRAAQPAFYLPVLTSAKDSWSESVCVKISVSYPSLHLVLTALNRGSKASVLPFVLPTEQLNQQEIQSHYINLWNHFNHLRALGWKRKTFTNDVQLWCFFLPLHASVFAFAAV